MKIWLLRPILQDSESCPWNDRYDKCFGMVVRAETEQEARELAQSKGWDETLLLEDFHIKGECPAWTDHSLSTCVELDGSGDATVIIWDIHHG